MIGTKEQNLWSYSPHPDGQRFLVKVAAERAAPSINVITHWLKAAPTAATK